MNFPIFLGCLSTFWALAGLLLMTLSREDADKGNWMFGAILFSIGTLLAASAFGIATA